MERWTQADRMAKPSVGSKMLGAAGMSEMMAEAALNSSGAFLNEIEYIQKRQREIYGMKTFLKKMGCRTNPGSSWTLLK